MTWAMTSQNRRPDKVGGRVRGASDVTERHDGYWVRWLAVYEANIGVPNYLPSLVEPDP